jgi:hypothetical protein
MEALQEVLVKLERLSEEVGRVEQLVLRQMATT